MRIPIGKIFRALREVSALGFVLFAGLIWHGRADARVDAIYSVPIPEEELANAAQYPTRSDQDVYGLPQTTGKMRFFLPPQLVGLETEFDLTRQSNGKWVGQGTDGSTVSGTCSAADRKWFSCNVTFQNLVFDSGARETVLERQFGRGFEFDRRTAVARHFEGQPIGIIKVRVRD